MTDRLHTHMWGEASGAPNASPLRLFPFDGFHDLTRIGESAHSELGEHGLAIDDHIEDALFSADKG